MLGTFGKCCYVYMRIVIGKVMFSYFAWSIYVHYILTYIYVKINLVPLGASTCPEVPSEVKVPRFRDNGTRLW